MQPVQGLSSQEAVTATPHGLSLKLSTPPVTIGGANVMPCLTIPYIRIVTLQSLQTHYIPRQCTLQYKTLPPPALITLIAQYLHNPNKEISPCQEHWVELAELVATNVMWLICKDIIIWRIRQKASILNHCRQHRPWPYVGPINGLISPTLVGFDQPALSHGCNYCQPFQRSRS